MTNPDIPPDHDRLQELAGAQPETLVDAVKLLQDAGYTTDVVFRDGTLRCSACHQTYTLEQVHTDVVYRFEGPSDPADEAIVFGVRFDGCGQPGIVVAGYGPLASADDQALVAGLDRGEPT